MSKLRYLDYIKSMSYLKPEQLDQSRLTRLYQLSMLEFTKQFKDFTEGFDPKSLKKQVEDLQKKLSSKQAKIEDDLQTRDKHPIISPSVEAGTRLSHSQLQNWVTQICSKTFSVTFNHYVCDRLTYDQAKIFCSESILLNIIRASERHHFTGQDIHFIDEHMQKKVIPYMLKKYPVTQQNVVNRALESSLEKINNFDSLSNDFLINAGISFRYRETGNYNDIIMLTINKALSQLNQLSKEKKDNKYLTHYQMFQKEMTQLFEKTEDYQWMNFSQEEHNEELELTSTAMKNKLHGLTQTYRDGALEQFKQLKLKEAEFKEKVKSYTHFLIGRKISENVEPFSDYEISSGKINIKNPSILRILIKWSEQLWQKFENPSYLFAKTEGIQCQGDTNLNIFYDWMKQQLSKKLTEEKQRIFQDIHDLKQNFYEQEAYHFLNNLQPDEFNHIEKYEKAFGKHAYQTCKILHNSNILTLNRLIHGLIKVGNSWHRQNQAMAKKYEGWKTPPNLVTFKIGDLMRCKCSSKEKEIHKLYNELMRISKERPDKLKVIRIKNRLRNDTNDILINIKFNNLIVGEIQLAVNTKKSKFIECSNYFNHYLYELERTIFGPISELCSIWNSIDSRRKEYQAIVQSQSYKKFDPLTLLAAIENSKCRNNHQHFFSNFNLPFQCSFCSISYFHSNYIIPNKKCVNCPIFKCVRCQFLSLDEQDLRKLTLGSDAEKYKDYKITKTNVLPEKGIAVKVTALHSKPRLFQKFTISGIEYYLTRENQKITKLIKSKKEINQFMHSHCVFEFLEVNKFLELDETIVKSEYVIPEYIKNCFISQNETLALNQVGLDQETMKKLLKSQKNICKPFKKLQLAGNSLTDPVELFDLFPNIESLNLDFNLVTNLEGISKLNNLKIFSLRNESQEGLTKLSDDFCHLSALEQLHLSYNSLKELPEQFYKLHRLQKLFIKSNLLQTLPDRFGELSQLFLLKLKGNLTLKHIPLELCKLAKLSILNVERCGLTEVPEQISNLRELKVLDISFNQIQKLPGSMVKMNQLQKLIFLDNLLEELPQNFEELTKLKYIDVSFNKLSKFTLGKNPNSKLEYLDFSNNLISELSQDICNLRYLKQLKLKNNQIACIHQNLACLSRLQMIDFKNNQLEVFPESLTDIYSLQILILSENKITSISDSISKMHQLKKLVINDNMLTTLSKSLSRLHLDELNISGNQLEILHESTLNKNHYLSKLEANRNKITYVAEDYFDNVRHLGLADNQICILQLSNEVNSTLVSLSLERNQIPAIPAQILQFTALTYLNLSGNRIDVIDPEFEAIDLNRVKINLTKNPIKAVKCRKLEGIIDAEPEHEMWESFKILPKTDVEISKEEEFECCD